MKKEVAQKVVNMYVFILRGLGDASDATDAKEMQLTLKSASLASQSAQASVDVVYWGELTRCVSAGRGQETGRSLHCFQVIGKENSA